MKKLICITFICLAANPLHSIYVLDAFDKFFSKERIITIGFTVAAVMGFQKIYGKYVAPITFDDRLAKMEESLLQEKMGNSEIINKIQSDLKDSQDEVKKLQETLRKTAAQVEGQESFFNILLATRKGKVALVCSSIVDSALKSLKSSDTDYEATLEAALAAKKKTEEDYLSKTSTRN